MSNGGAFPIIKSKSTLGGVLIDSFGGLTKRELFAAMAMQGLLGTITLSRYEDSTIMGVVRASVEYADALIAELAKD